MILLNITLNYLMAPVLVLWGMWNTHFITITPMSTMGQNRTV